MKSEVGIKMKRKKHLYERNVSCNEKIENDNKTKKGIADVYVIAKQKLVDLDCEKEKSKYSPYMSKDKPTQIDKK